jgi:hypothetical protein
MTSNNHFVGFAHYGAPMVQYVHPFGDFLPRMPEMDYPNGWFYLVYLGS